MVTEITKEIKRESILIICLLGNPSNLINGGYHRTIFELIENFKNTKWQIDIVTLDTSISEVSKRNMAPNIIIHYIPINPAWIEQQDILFNNKGNVISQIREIIFTFYKLPFVIHSFHWFSGYISSILSTELNIPQIHNIIALSYERLKNNISLRCKYQRYCEEKTFEHAKLILTISEAEKQNLIEQYNISETKIILVGRNVSSCFSNLSHDPSGNINSSQMIKYVSRNLEMDEWWISGAFCYFGRIIPYKGIKEIILAWESLYNKYQNLMPPLWIVGGDTDTISSFRNNHLKSIPKLDYYERIHKIYWWGYLNSDGISNLLLKCSLVIMHSHFEPGGRIVIESMAAGKPVIGTECGFAQSYIYDWYNGFTLPYGNIDSLSYFMEYFIKNKYLSNMMGINGQNYFQNISESWSYFRRIENIYKYFYDNTNPCPTNPKSIKPKKIYPNKLNIFPYCDIKNSITDIKQHFNIAYRRIEECSSESYIWKIYSTDSNYIIKQYYNRLNLKQLWNSFDKHQVITIWMLYNSAINSFHSTSVIQPIKIAEEIFSFCIPYGKLIDLYSEKDYLKIYNLIYSFHFEKKVVYNKKRNLKNEITYFQRENENMQLQHKYYTLDILLYELEDILNTHSSIFLQTNFEYNTIILLKKSSLKLHKEFGLIYGKSFEYHIINQNDKLFLLPSADIYWGEIGYDEAKTFLSLFTFSSNINRNIEIMNKISSIYILNILIWSCALILEKIISNEILHISNEKNIIFLNNLVNFTSSNYSL